MNTLAKAPSILFGQPHFDREEEDAVVAVVRSGWIGQGAHVQAFEAELGTYVAVPHAIAVSSCTAALHLSLVAAGIGPGDEVITTPFTFVATVNAIEHTGATPVFVDIDPDTLNVSPQAAAAAIGPRTRALLPVHFGGRPVDLAGFRALADAHDLWLVEDAAHAVGAVSGGARIGNGSHARSLTCFSFYPNKNLATAEGGAICLADGDLAERIRSLRLHGLNSDAWDRYQSAAYRPALATAPGFKYNMTDLQASIARVQLRKLEGFLAIREYLADRYDQLLTGIEGVQLLARPTPGVRERHALHLYQVVLAGWVDRDRAVARLKERGIGAAVHYIGVNLHPYYRTRIPGRFPVSDWASRSLLSLPLHPRLSDDDQQRIAGELADAVETCRLGSVA